MAGPSLSQRLVAFVTLPTAIALGLGWFWLDDPALFLKEGHTVEICSVLLLLQGIACWVAVRGRGGWRDWQIPAILGLFALREMDADKRFTESGLLKLRSYAGDAPLGEKLLGACAVLFSLLVIWRLVRRNVPAWRQDLRGREPYAIAVLLAALMTVAGKALDGLGRKLLDLGIVLSARADTRAGHAEEWLELAAWWLLCLAVAWLPAARNPGPARAMAAPRN